MNEARKDFVVVAYKGKLYAVGGQDENMVMCTVECYSVATEEWDICASIRYVIIHGYNNCVDTECLQIDIIGNLCFL